MENKGANSELFIYLIVIIGIIFGFIKTYQFFNERINRLNCEANTSTIQESIIRYRTSRPEVVTTDDGQINMRLLVEGKFLPMYLTCPNSGRYKIDAKDKVYCTEHSYSAGGK